MQPAFYYRHSGMTIASDLALPEWEHFRAPAVDCPDVRIELADASPPTFADDSEVTVADGTLRFAIPGIGGWEIVDGETIRLYPGLAADPAELRLFTLGSAWAALGYLRGYAMWHGSCVQRGEGAVLVCGEAGAGKSTLAAALVARGAALVADDLSRVDATTNHTKIFPSASRIKLWREAMDCLEWGDRRTGRDWLREDKFHCAPQTLTQGSSPVLLHAIVVLGESAQLGLTRLEGGAAVSAVLQGTVYRPQMLDALAAWGGQGAAAARAAATTPIYRLARPKDFAKLDESCAAIEALF